MDVFLKGFFLGAGLIIAIGAQNAFILRQGLKKEYVFACCLIAASCDAILITAGVLGFAAFISSMPGALEIIRWLGAIFLTLYGLKAFLSAFKEQHLDTSQATKTHGGELKKAIAVVLALTLLNPHVYLDTVVLLGGISSSYQTPENYVFGLGAVIASFVWFFSLGYGAGYLQPLFQKPIAWKVLDIIIALVMWGIALSLIWPVLF